MSHKHFLTALHQMYSDQERCDVIFSCPDENASSGKSTIAAHKNILSCSSDVFNRMFYGSMAQNNEEQGSNEIEVEDIYFSTFKVFLSFIYGKVDRFQSVKEASDFYYAVDKYNCKDGLTYVVWFLLKELKAENAIFIYESTLLYNNEKLMNACLNLFSEVSDKVFASDAFLTAKPETVETIFRLDPININSELDLVKALGRYVEANKEKDPKIGLKVLPATGAIRFLTLTSKEITETTLLSSEEIKNVVECLTTERNLSKMPKHLSDNRNKRNLMKSHIKMVRQLSNIYSVKICYFCARSNIPRSVTHALWTCEVCSDSWLKINLKAIFDKYKHTSLMEYDRKDLEAVFNIYKSKEYLE